MTLTALRKLAPYLLVAALFFVVLFQRNTITDRTAKLEASQKEAKDLTEANKANAKVIASLSARQVDNDAIANAVASKIQVNVTRETIVRTNIEKAKANDPQVRAWADTPIPDSVRRALRADPK